MAYIVFSIDTFSPEETSCLTKLPLVTVPSLNSSSISISLSSNNTNNAISPYPIEPRQTFAIVPSTDPSGLFYVNQTSGCLSLRLLGGGVHKMATSARLTSLYVLNVTLTDNVFKDSSWLSCFVYLVSSCELKSLVYVSQDQSFVRANLAQYTR